MTAPTLLGAVGNKSAAKDGVDLVTSVTTTTPTECLLVLQVGADAASATVVAPTCTVDTGSGATAGPSFSAVGPPIVPVTGSGRPIINAWTTTISAAATVSVTTDTVVGRVGVVVIFRFATGTTFAQRTPTPAYVTTAGAPSAIVTTVNPDSMLVWLSYDQNVSGGTPAYRSGATERYKAQNVVFEMSGYWATQPTGSTPGDQTVGMTAPNQVWTLGVIEAIAPASGTNYTASPADQVGVSDTSTPMTFDVSDNIGDQVGTTDAVGASQATARTTVDSEGITDQAATLLGLARTQGDPVGLTDAVTVTWDRQVTQGDQVGGTDQALPNLSTVGGSSVTDPAGVTDLAGAQQDAQRAAADQVALTDQVATQLARAAAPADQVGITDPAPSVQQDRVGGSAVTDPTGVSDQASAQQASTRTTDDLASVADTAVSSLAAARTTDDALATTDAVVAVLIPGEAPGPIVAPQLLTNDELAWMREVQGEARPTPAVLRRRTQGTTSSGGRTNSYQADIPITIRIDNTEARVPAQVTAIVGAGKAAKITMDLVESQSGDLIKVSDTEVYEQVTDGDPDQWATAQVVWAKRTVSPRRA